MTGVTGQLLGVKWRAVGNALREGRLKLGLRAGLFLILGGGFWAFIFGASYWFVDQCQQVELFGDVLVEKFVAMALLIVFAVLFFSNLVSSFSVYFLASDLQLLMPQPIPPYPLYSARFTELLLQSSWMAGLYSLPVFIAVGLVYSAGPGFYLILVVLLLPLPIIATALATIVSLVLTNLLPARRTRELLALLVVLLFVVVFIVFRSLEPERFLNPDERANIVEVLSAFDPPRLGFLPSDWVHRALWPSVSGEHRATSPYAICLYSTAAGLFFIGGWIFRGLHFTGYSKAAEGRHEGAAPERIVRRLLGRRQTAMARGRYMLDAMRRKRRRLGYYREMWRKDYRTFLRDTAQWTQLVLLVALVIIYLINFKYVRSIGEGGIIGPVGLYFANLGLASFVITAISVRFAFPMVSLEGRSLWLIRTAPKKIIDFLKSKWWTASISIWLFGQLLTLTSNWLIGARPALCLTAMVFQTPATIGVVGLGIGLGSLFPRFTVNNAAKIATGFGGFFYMVVGVFLNLLVVALSVFPTMTLIRMRDGYAPWLVTGPRIALALGLTLVALVAPLLVAWLIIRLGAYRLDQRS